LGGLKNHENQVTIVSAQSSKWVSPECIFTAQENSDDKLQEYVLLALAFSNLPFPLQNEFIGFLWLLE